MEEGIWFNLNYHVEVVLNDVGAKILNDKRNKLAEYLQSIGVNPESHEPAKAGDRHREQLWALMADFGPFLSNGSPVPFHHNTLFISNKEIEYAASCATGDEPETPDEIEDDGESAG